MALCDAGKKVSVLEPDPNAAERVEALLRRANSVGALPVVTGDWAAMEAADLLIEALDDAPELVPRFAASLRPEVTVILTTPGLGTEVQGKCPDPGQVVNMSLAQPVHLRRLVEVTPVVDSRPDAIEAAVALIRAMKRHPFVSSVGHPSPATRLLMRCLDTADMMLLRGSVPDEIDDAMVAFGYDLGLYRAQDWAGLSAAHAERRRRRDDLLQPFYEVPIADRMVAEGRLGRMFGVGWYRYPGGGGAVIDPIVEDLIREEARFESVAQRSFDARAIQIRLHLCLVDEGLNMLADGAVSAASDIDLLAVEGLGFPSAKGGPIALCDELGLADVRRRFEALEKEEPSEWPTPELLSACDAAGRELSDVEPTAPRAANHQQS